MGVSFIVVVEVGEEGFTAGIKLGRWLCTV